MKGRGKNRGSHLANLRPWGVGGRVKRVCGRRSYIPKNVGMRREWGWRDSGKGVGGAVRGHYGFMHNVEMSGSGF